MLSRYWNVLLVDDEPDVLAFSRLALKGLTIYGLPLRIHEPNSKAEAVLLLRAGLSGSVEGVDEVAVAFIDAVMETETAGLDLCRCVREELQNRTTQLYVRTGQPGIAHAGRPHAGAHRGLQLPRAYARRSRRLHRSHPRRSEHGATVQVRKRS